MDAKPLLIPKVLLLALVVIAVLIAAYFFFPGPVSARRGLFPAVAVLAVIFALLGIALIVLAARVKADRMLKVFLILTGSAATGVVLCVILHNVLYGLLIYCFGDDFWDRVGVPDEPVFFILALFVCPALFCVGAIGSIVLLAGRGKHPPITKPS